MLDLQSPLHHFAMIYDFYHSRIAKIEHHHISKSADWKTSLDYGSDLEIELQYFLRKGQFVWMCHKDVSYELNMKRKSKT